MNTTLEASAGPAENATGQTVGGLGCGLGLSLGILVIFVFTTYAFFYMCARRQGSANLNIRHLSTHRSSATNDNWWYRRGLDETTISTYPQFIYSQLKLHKCESTSSACSICLADYKDTDLIRLLPDCGHFFHCNCIDLWLKVNPTCPICRNSPLPTSLVEVNTHLIIR